MFVDFYATMRNSGACKVFIIRFLLHCAQALGSVANLHIVIIKNQTNSLSVEYAFSVDNFSFCDGAETRPHLFNCIYSKWITFNMCVLAVL